MIQFLHNTRVKHSKFISELRRLILPSWTEEVFNLALLYTKEEETRGDYYEFGSFAERSIILMNALAKLSNIQMNYHAYDSFEGLPETDDKEYKVKWKKGDYTCSIEEFTHNLKKAKFPMNSLTINKGYFKDTVKLRGKPKARIIYIDCDYQSSTEDVLKEIHHILQDGTIVLFDDYHSGSQRTCVDNYKNKEFEFISISDFTPYGKMFRTKIKSLAEEKMNPTITEETSLCKGRCGSITKTITFKYFPDVKICAKCGSEKHN